ncbi:MAG: hypothetical protein WC081_03760 [Candidatus Ratteibacteria bacterium]|jgi:hypothetical protein
MTSATNKFPDRDARVIRGLASRVAELARSEEYEKRRRRWRDVNCLRRPDRAPVWCRPALVWREILPPDALECADPFCREVETILRQHLYKDWVGDDHIIEPWWGVGAIFNCDSEHIWGLPANRSTGTTDQGGFQYYHPIETPEDYEKITVPSFVYDPAATQRAAAKMEELLGNAMPVRVTGNPPLGPVQGTYLEQLRGMGPMLDDLAFRPHLVHRAMAKLTEGILRGLRAAEKAGVLTPNNHEPMFCSDPLNDKPANGPVALRHLWTAANSQEFDQTSSAMQEEFLLSYQKVVFQQFGAVQYGCCESLTKKIDIVRRIPNLRIFVCSFWSDLDKIIEACDQNYTIMWRQSAAQVTVNPTLEEHRRHLESGLKRLRGHFYQIVLRELETLNGRPERLREWARMAIELAEKHA